MTRDNSIVVEQLVREFKKGPRAVDGIDLYVAPGEIYGFLGPNGAGKSTIGRPSIHVIPCREEDRPRIAALLQRFGEPLGEARDLAVRVHEGLGLVDVIRAMDTDGVVVDDVELRAPTLDDVFLAKTGRTLEGAASEGDGAPAG